MRLGLCVRVGVRARARVCAKGSHLQLFHHTSQSTDMFCLFVSLHFSMLTLDS